MNWIGSPRCFENNRAVMAERNHQFPRLFRHRCALEIRAEVYDRKISQEPKLFSLIPPTVVRLLTFEASNEVCVQMCQHADSRAKLLESTKTSILLEKNGHLKHSRSR